MLFQKKKKNLGNKILSALLLAAMLVTMLPFNAGSALAAEIDAEPTNEAVLDEGEAALVSEEDVTAEPAGEAEAAQNEQEAEPVTEAEADNAGIALTAEEDTTTEDTTAGSTPKLKIQYGNDVYVITEAEWEKLVEEKAATYTYSTNHRSGPVCDDKYIGVPLNTVVAAAGIDVTKLSGSEIVTFRSDDGGSMAKMTVDDVFNTTRYWYPYDAENNTFVETGKVEVPILIVSEGERAGRLIVGVSAIDNGDGEFVKQYWWNGLFNTAENQFISIEIPKSETTEDGSGEGSGDETDSTEPEETTGYASGTGTAEDPYMIATAEQLKYLAEQVNSGVTYEGEYLKLSADIDLNNEAWTPIGGGAALTEADEEGYDCGTPTYKFLGTFDGDGHTIKNLKIEADSNFVGLFGHNGGTLKNFTLEGDVAVTNAHDYVGAIAAFNSGTIKRVINKATMNAPDCYNVGGIVGVNVGFDGKWKDGANNDKTGIVKNAVGIVTECGNEAKIIAMRSIGGIVGKTFGEISYCYNYGDIDFWYHGSMSKIGGIAGTLEDTGNEHGVGHVTNCYNTGAINWINTSESSKGYGGIACFLSRSSSITNCYSIGDLKEGRNDYAPILPRYDTANLLINNYSLDTIVTACTGEACNGVRKTEKELKSSDFLTAIGGAYEADKNNINNGYPVLKWQNGTSAEITGVEANVSELTFVEGQTFDNTTTDLKIYALYSDGTKALIPCYSYAASKTDAFTMEDEGSTLTVTCDGGSVNVTVKMEKKELSYILISAKPSKYTYCSGEEFDSTGMTVRAYYTNELLTSAQKSALVEDYTYTTNGTLSENNKTVTVTYELNGDKASVSFDVVVIDPGTAPAADENGVYQIKTAADLVWMSKQVNYLANTELNVCLMDSIDVSDTEFIPLGSSLSQSAEQTLTIAENGTAPSSISKLYYTWNNSYKGTFDGNGKAVTLKLEGAGYQALVGNANNAVVKDVTVKGSVTSTGNYTAGIVANGTATISGCTNEAVITSTNSYVGGVAGMVAGTITDCVNKGAVTGAMYTAGIVSRNATQIENCSNEGVITATGNYAGGITSYGNSKIIKCSNSGAITGTCNVGGILGYSTGAEIENCYNKGNVAATAATATNGVGGLVGTKTNSVLTITNCYNIGTISTGETAEEDDSIATASETEEVIIAVGELLGYANGNTSTVNTTITNSYYLQGEGKVSIGNAKADVVDNSQPKTLEELSTMAETLSSAYQNSCGGAVFTTQTAVEHTMGEWSEDTATFTEAGEQSRTCEVCEFVEVKETTNYAVLEAAEAKYAELKAAADKAEADQAAANAVIANIDAIGMVTLESKAAIDSAKAAYEQLTEDQKALVTNYAELEAAEVQYAAVKAAADQATANLVIANITNIGKVTLESKAAIGVARATYGQLTEDQKALVTNYAELEAAEAKYAELKAVADKEEADQAAANAVMAGISNIGKVTLESKAAIDSAKAAYEQLTEDQKALVTNYADLEAAEAKYAELKAAADQEDSNKETEKNQTGTSSKDESGNGNSKDDQSGSVATGDSNYVYLWVILLVAAAAVGGVAVCGMRRKRK